MKMSGRASRVLVVFFFIASTFSPQFTPFAIGFVSGGEAACESHALVDGDQRQEDAGHTNQAHAGVLSHCAAHHVYCGPPATLVDLSLTGSEVVRTVVRFHPSRTESVELHPPRS